jgi:hypothetical protein
MTIWRVALPLDQSLIDSAEKRDYSKHLTLSILTESTIGGGIPHRSDRQNIKNIITTTTTTSELAKVSTAKLSE